MPLRSRSIHHPVIRGVQLIAVLFAALLVLLAVPSPGAGAAGAGLSDATGQLDCSPALAALASASGGTRAASRPVITRLSRASAAPGVRLTIRGRGFGKRRGKGAVVFGAFKSTKYLRWSATRIVCTVPGIPAGKLALKVRAGKRLSAAKRFTVKALRTVVPATTNVLDAASVAGATTSDGSTYSFATTSQTSGLEAGDVIVAEPTGALPEGIFREVTSVTGGGSIVSTAPATLDDAFKSAQFSGRHAITQSDFKSGAVAPGVRLVRYRAVDPDSRLLTFRLTDVGVSQSANLGADFGPVTLSGTITLKITVHVGGAVSGGKVSSFEVSETTTVSSDLRASVTNELSFGKEKTLASWGVGKLAGFTVMAGPVPLYFQPELAIFVGVNGQFQAGVETAVHYEASGTLGLTYQPPAFSTFTRLSTKKSYTPPRLYASGSVKAYAGVQLGLKLYAAAGPYIRLGGFAKLAADTRKTPWWKLTAGVEASMGAEIGGDYGFIHWSVGWRSGDLTIVEWKLAQARTPPGPAPTPTPPPSGPAIGDAHGGGIVAYILQPGDPGYVAGQTHGLIAAAADQSPSGWCSWAAQPFWSTDVPGARGTAIGSGAANTDAIIAQNGAGTGYAAGLARAYAGGGYRDWYLPSKDELHQLFLNRVAIGGFNLSAMSRYWSSSQGTITGDWLVPTGAYAWIHQFEYDFAHEYRKFQHGQVRAVRAF